MRAQLQTSKDLATGRDRGSLVLHFDPDEHKALSAGFPGQQARVVVEGSCSKGMRIYYTTRSDSGFILDSRYNSVRLPHFRAGSVSDKNLPQTTISAHISRGEDGPELMVEPFPDEFWRPRNLNAIAERLFRGAAKLSHDHGKDAKALQIEISRPAPVAQPTAPFTPMSAIAQPLPKYVAPTQPEQPTTDVAHPGYSIEDLREAARLLNECLALHAGVTVMVDNNRVVLRRRVEVYEDL